MYEKDAMTGSRWCPWGHVWDPYHERMVPFPGTEANPSRLVTEEAPHQDAIAEGCREWKQRNPKRAAELERMRDEVRR